MIPGLSKLVASASDTTAPTGETVVEEAVVEEAVVEEAVVEELVEPHTVRLVPVPPTIRTAFPARPVRGRIAYDACVPVGKSNAGWWVVTPGTAAALERAEAELQVYGFRGMRLIRASVKGLTLHQQRQRFESWVKAGRPARIYNPRVMSRDWAPVVNRGFAQAGCSVVLDVDSMVTELPPVAAGYAHALLDHCMMESGFVLTGLYRDGAPREYIHVSDSIDALRDMLMSRRGADGEPPVMALLPLWEILAEVGCILIGNHRGENQAMRQVQARLLLAGIWCGLPTGILGPLGRAAMQTLGFEVTTHTPAAVLHALLDQERIGLDAIAAM